jgi:iron complex outermembrane receptor protein
MVVPRNRPAKGSKLDQRCRDVSTVAATVIAILYGAAAGAENATAAETELASATAVADAGTSTADTGLAEVVVTATRHEASAQDLPLSITAVTAAQLQQAGIEDISDLSRTLSGVSYTDKGPFSGVNGANLVIRGLNSETTAGLPAAASPVVPPVSTYVDDTPIFVSLRFQDLDRVEVLKGPQGTLYGSGSLGGTIKFIEHAPDLSGFDAKVEATLSDTQHTGAPNEDVSGMINIPLNDTIAVRANASFSHDAGFINQPNLFVLGSNGSPAESQPGNPLSDPVFYGRNHVNDYGYATARISALWNPSEAFRAQLSYYHQLSTAQGYPYAATSTAAFNMPISPNTQPGGTYTNPPLAPQLYTEALPAGIDRLSDAENSTTTTTDEVDLAALTLDYDLGFATLTSSTSWSDHSNATRADETAQYSNFFFYQSLYGQYPRTFIQGYERLNDKPITQELRLVSKEGGELEWVTGLFYNHQQTNIQEHDFEPGYLDFYNACEPIYGQSAGDGTTPSYCGVGETGAGTVSSYAGIPIVKDQAYIGDFETTFRDLALFGDITWHATSNWSVTGGGRVFKQTIDASQQTGLLFDAGPFFAPAIPIANIRLGNTWRRATWKANTSYQLDKTNLVYATFSQGFRRGSVNALPPSELGGVYTLPTALRELSPDTANNYEVGFKGTIENQFKYSVAAYYIDWRNVQEGLQLTPLVLPASMNIGHAYSKGIENEMDALITRHLEAQFDYTYDQTKLISLNPLFVSPNVSAPPPGVGTALPGTPRNSLALTLKYGHIQINDGELYFSVSGHYQSSVLPALSATVPTVAGYTMASARVGYDVAHWSAALFVNNLTNNLGITSYQDPAIFGNRAQAIVSQPRTIGLTVAYSYK